MEAVTAEARLFIYARRQSGLSQRRMATRLCINQSSISKIESGTHRPRVSTIRKLERLMGQSAEHLACLAMGKPIPAPEPQKPAPASEAKVIRLNPRYRKMETSDLAYLRARFFTHAYELERKAMQAAHFLSQKTLKHKLHRLNMEHLEQQYQSAAAIHAHLERAQAPATLQDQTKTALDLAASRLKKQRYYGINIPNAAALAREQMKIEEMRLKVDLLRTNLSQIENILTRRKRPQTTGKGRVVALAANSFPRRQASQQV
ncbi:multiprotein-bridging factor 1 family protein [Roseivirga sp. BDSF3-8]|uniref:helix-turn-helix domain-containing protein n=1 Tax=Roseivirga sp. BDSF3-8 TaxID=3241598 RepID=UPI0035318D04